MMLVNRYEAVYWYTFESYWWYKKQRSQVMTKAYFRVNRAKSENSNFGTDEAC